MSHQKVECYYCVTLINIVSINKNVFQYVPSGSDLAIMIGMRIK